MQPRKSRAIPHADFRSIELMLVVGVIMVCASAQVVLYGDSVIKAKVIGPFGALAPERVQASTDFAVTGEWNPSPGGQRADTPAASAAKSRRIASVRDLEETHQMVARTSQLIAEVEGFGLSKVVSTSTLGFSTGLSEGIPTAAVSVSFLDAPALIELRPAHAAVDPPVVYWLCGRQAPPKGTITPAPRVPAVPDPYLPHVCRMPT